MGATMVVSITLSILFAILWISMLVTLVRMMALKRRLVNQIELPDTDTFRDFYGIRFWRWLYSEQDNINSTTFILRSTLKKLMSFYLKAFALSVVILAITITYNVLIHPK